MGFSARSSKFIDDIKLFREVNTKGLAAVQKDVDRIERWACVTLRKFKNAKYIVLLLDQGNPKHNNRLGRKWIKRSPGRKDFNGIC